jgi:hypothetical protein
MRVAVAVQATATWAFARSSVLRRKAMFAGEVADFVGWQADRFGRARTFRSREHLWSELRERMSPGRPWHVLEFGVAEGYATRWWLERLTAEDVTWDGFDRFTGLPRAWRRLPAGAFDAGGRPPSIDDPRITWHIGDVSEKLRSLDAARFGEGGRLVLFDLDLYEPTVAAWRFVQPLLRAGDLLYFDEAMDGDERRVLDELVLPAGAYDYVGGTGWALALAVR